MKVIFCYFILKVRTHTMPRQNSLLIIGTILAIFVISSAHCKDMPVFYCYFFHVGFKFHLLLLYRIHIITFFIDFKITYIAAHYWQRVCILVLIIFGTDDFMSSEFNILDRIARFPRFFGVLCEWHWCWIKYCVWCWLTCWNSEMEL